MNARLQKSREEGIALIDHNCILSSYTFVAINTFISVRFYNIILMTSLINSVLSYYFIYLHYDSLYTNVVAALQNYELTYSKMTPEESK